MVASVLGEDGLIWAERLVWVRSLAEEFTVYCSFCKKYFTWRPTKRENYSSEVIMRHKVWTGVYASLLFRNFLVCEFICRTKLSDEFNSRVRFLTTRAGLTRATSVQIKLMGWFSIVRIWGQQVKVQFYQCWTLSWFHTFKTVYTRKYKENICVNMC